MDEAGLGPNLGPFVVAASVWEVPSSPGGFDFWKSFRTVLTNAPRANEKRLHVADSKQVFQPGNGIASLERGVWTALRLCGVQAATFHDLCAALSCPLGPHLREETARMTGAEERASLPPNHFAAEQPLRSGDEGPLDEQQPSLPVPLPRRQGRENRNVVELHPAIRRSLFDDDELAAAFGMAEPDGHEPPPWYAAGGLTLPVESIDESLVAPWQNKCERLGVRLVALRAHVVEPSRFNRLVRRHDNKAAATSRLAMKLLREIWHPDDEGEVLVVADKHGGRNYYELMLTETFPGRTVVCLEEGAELSAYRIGNCELRFQPRAEEHGPVALASMTAKYLRELAMHQFNHFWRERMPGLKPTQGYPLDAKRFRAEIVELQQSLGIADDVLWRER
jgi:hypothetical protein